MCGIAGIFNSKRYANYENINKMLCSIEHRGPDDMSASFNDNSALGSVRLKIFKLEEGQQPYISKDKETIICLNGEIFNFMDLLNEIKSLDVNIKIKSEVELIYYMFKIFGSDFIEKINGQFAISIKENDKLFLYRDPFGIRPLFYTVDKGEILFCSEIKGIISVKKELGINYNNLGQIIKFWTLIGENTIFENIFQIEAGSYVIFEGLDIKKIRYFNDKYDSADKVKYKNLNEAKEDFYTNLLNAVKRQMHGDVEIGAYLSGGIDSTAITYLLKNLNQNTKTFSINFDNKEYDESHFQNIAINNIKVNNTSIKIGNEDISNIFQKVIYHTETPIFRTAPSPLFLLSKLVNNNSIKVIMTGEGADEILYGYDIFKESKIRNFIKRNKFSKYRWNLLKKLYAYLPQFQNPRYFNMIKEFYSKTIDENSKLYSFLPRLKNNSGIFNFFNEDFLSTPIDDYSEIDKFLDKDFDKIDELQKIEDFEIKTLLTNYLLSSQGDRMTMANSVEGRYPFLDLEFVRYARRIPNEFKLNLLKDKHILRECFKDKLPSSLYNRPKIAYQAPEIKSFFQNKKTKEYISDYLSNNSLSKVGIYNIKNINNVINKAQKSHLQDRMSFRENSGITIILSLQIIINEFKSTVMNLKYEKKTRII